MLTYIDGLLIAQKARPPTAPRTLVEAFVQIESEMVAQYGGPDQTETYYRDVAGILLEVAGTTLASIPLTFASVIGTLFKFRIDLPSLLPQIMLKKDGLTRLIYEAERLNPTLPVRMRYCERDTNLPSRTTVVKGDWVATLVGAANIDPRVFPKPYLISLDRDLDKYLLFNEAGSERECWGRDRVAMAVMQECVLCAGRLGGLRRVAGPAGEPVKLGNVAIGLPARFTQVGPKLPGSVGS
jgi:hypothetical protein